MLTFSFLLFYLFLFYIGMLITLRIWKVRNFKKGKFENIKKNFHSRIPKQVILLTKLNILYK